MTEEKVEVQVQYETEDGYEVVLSQNSDVSEKAFRIVTDYMETNGLGLYPQIKERINKWHRQKVKLFAILQTIFHKDPKVIVLASERDKGHGKSIWVHDIIPLIPVMEQPFRLIMIQWMEAMGAENNCKVIIPQHLRESAEFEGNDVLTIDEASKIFDQGESEMRETGKLTSVVTPKTI